MINPLSDEQPDVVKPKKKHHVAPKVEAESKIEAPEKKEPVQAEPAKQNLVIHSELDAMIMDRQKSQPKTLKDVDAEVVTEEVPGKHRLSLPDEILPYAKKYAFCWIFKRKQAIDEAMDQKYYKMTNRTYFPEVPDHCFSARGVIERGDNILMFRPIHIDTEMRKAPGIESTARVKARTSAHEGDPNYYVPASDEDGGKVVGV